MIFMGMGDRMLPRRELDGSFGVHGDLSAPARWRLDDMLVDHNWRAWAANFRFDGPGSGEGLGPSNGMPLAPELDGHWRSVRFGGHR
jgi:hypothetical protein